MKILIKKISLVLYLFGAMAHPGPGPPCIFNSMCQCRHQHQNITNIKEINCVSVPFSILPDFDNAKPSHIDIIDAGLEVLENDGLLSPNLISIRLINNDISVINEKSFSSVITTLRSLDLSYNKLESIPVKAVKNLKTLDWLNLHSNQIVEIDEDVSWGGLSFSLTNLFLGENDIKTISKGSPLFSLYRLSWINLDHNRISKIDLEALPERIRTLSLSHNDLRDFPSHILNSQNEIAWLYLRNNHIETIKKYNFINKQKLDKVDLGENYLKNLPPNCFNNSLTVKELNLDYNQFKDIAHDIFPHLNVKRLSISHNGVISIHLNAFKDLLEILEFLDIGWNKLGNVPKAISQLKRLKYLYLPSNNISELEEFVFSNFSNSLAALSLSENKIENIPVISLKNCTNLNHLNLGYNYIREIRQDDFESWGINLDTLLLMNNRISQLRENIFKFTPNLRELSLSFNKITHIAPTAFQDIDWSLESLEISFGIFEEELPEQFLKSLKKVSWLALDNNNFKRIKSNVFQNQINLQYLNLEGNKLTKLPQGLFNPEIHNKLKDIRLSDNYLEVLESFTFFGLENLQLILASRNQIATLRSSAFHNLTNSVTIILSDNRLSNISPRTFNNIHKLIKLDLHNNYLEQISLDIFHNSTNFNYPLTFNLSSNFITKLIISEDFAQIFIKIIDLSNNKLGEIPKIFFSAIGHSLQKINLCYNNIISLNEHAFGPLQAVDTIKLQHNSIIHIKRKAFQGVINLQILDLSHNHIEQLHFEQFRGLNKLRVLDASHNHIRFIPKDAFFSTKLERINLSHNELVTVPSNAFGEVGYTLREIDISNNNIEHLDSTIFPEIPLLTAVNLCNNKITLIPDNVFTSIGGLLKLKLCNNRIRANFKELFHYLQNLRELNLGNSDIKNVPILPLPNLIVLNLTKNHISELAVTSIESLAKLRTLIISHCKFTSVPSDIWIKLPLLKHLDMSHNYIKALSAENFLHLNRLQSLSISNLYRLKRVDGDTLSSCRDLLILSCDASPWLAGLLPNLSTLQKLKLYSIGQKLIRITPSFPPKLNYLEISGFNLREIDPRAFLGLKSESRKEFTLALKGTSVEELPPGFLSSLQGTNHVTLDLRDNRLSSLSPDSFYYNHTGWHQIGTKLLSGGVLLSGNRWICDCNLVWLGPWLRRWAREALQVHTMSSEAASNVNRALRSAVCTDVTTDRRIPLADLRPEELSCHASALSNAPSSKTLTPQLLLLIIFLKFS